MPSTLTSRLISFLVLAIIACASTGDSWAVSLGQSQQSVRAELGLPRGMKRENGQQTWSYPNGIKVVFEGGVVVSFGETPSAAVPSPAPVASTAPVSESAPQKLAPELIHQPAPAVKTAPAAPKPSKSVVSASADTTAVSSKGTFNLLFVLSAGAFFILHLWFVVEAFAESPLWGLGVLFVPFMSLIFTVVHWERAKRPVLLSVVVIAVIVLVVSAKKA